MSKSFALYAASVITARAGIGSVTTTSVTTVSRRGFTVGGGVSYWAEPSTGPPASETVALKSYNHGSPASGEDTIFARPSDTGYVDGAAGVARFDMIENGLVFDPVGEALYLQTKTESVFTGTAAIRKLDLETGVMTTFAGGASDAAWGFAPIDGSATTAKFAFNDIDKPGAGGMAVGPGSLYVKDEFKFAIRKVDLATSVTTTLAGGTNGVSIADNYGTQAQFDFMYSRTELAFDVSTQELFLATPPTGNTGQFAHIRKINCNSSSPDFGYVTLVLQATNYPNSPQPIYVDGVSANARFQFGVLPAIASFGGSVWFAQTDTSARAVRQVTLPGGLMTTLAGGANTGSVDGIPGEFEDIQFVAFDPATALLLVVDGGVIRQVETSFTGAPTTAVPTTAPSTKAPTSKAPTTNVPTKAPTTKGPTKVPTKAPTTAPTEKPKLSAASHATVSAFALLAGLVALCY